MGAYYFAENVLNTFIYHPVGTFPTILWSKYPHYIYRKISLVGLSDDLHRGTGYGQ